MKLEDVKRESKSVDFKESFDVNSQGDWCEIIKDIVAMANSGGGTILIGIRDDGSLSEFDVSSVLSYDPAKVIDKIAKYTGEQFSEFEITPLDRDGQKVAALGINAASTPIVFNTEGTYQHPGGKPKTAFAKGTVYFRHGAKSEPGSTNDLREAIKRELSRVRKSWFSGIRKVVEAPTGSRINILPPDTKVTHPPKVKKILPPEIKLTSQPGATAIRITDDPNAPAYRNVSPDQTHPHRLKDVARLVRQKIGGTRAVTAYDISCIRKVYNIDTKPEFFYKPMRYSPQYSDFFIEWLVEKYKNDPPFFDKAREKCKGN